jgi:hypothetical protein
MPSRFELEWGTLQPIWVVFQVENSKIRQRIITVELNQWPTFSTGGVMVVMAAFVTCAWG